MTNNENTRYIYIRSTKERIPCTQAEFDAYYHDINLYRQRQQHHGKCVCPANKRLDCDMDCESCPFRRAGDFRSLDITATDDDGNETSWIDSIADPSPQIDDLIAHNEEWQNILKRIQEIMPDAVKIGLMRLEGLTDTEISATLGVRQNTMFYRLKKAKETLQKEFPEFF